MPLLPFSDFTPQVNSDWNATSGVAQILNKPTIPAAQVNSDWNATSGVSQILNKPTIPPSFDQSLNTTDSPTFYDISATDVIISPVGTLDSVTWGYINGTSSELNSDGSISLYNRPELPNNGASPNTLMAVLADLYWYKSAYVKYKVMLSGYSTSADLANAGNISLKNIDNTFTAGQTITNTASTSALTASYSVTGANTTPLLDLSGTWNTTGVATGIKLNITSTASATTSKLFDLQTSGASAFSVQKDGTIAFNSVAGSGAGYGNFTPANTPAINLYQSTGLRMQLRPTDLTFYTATGSTNPVILTADASNTLALRNGTAAQLFRIYNTYTDASNYERGFMRWNSNTLEIGTEAGGTGTARALNIIGSNADFTIGGTLSMRVRSGSSNANTITCYAGIEWAYPATSANPTTTDIASGRSRMWKNTTTGVVALWANDGGTMKSLALV